MPLQLVRWLNGEVNPDSEDFLVKAYFQQVCGEHMRGEAVPWFIECSFSYILIALMNTKAITFSLELRFSKIFHFKRSG